MHQRQQELHDDAELGDQLLAVLSTVDSEYSLYAQSSFTTSSAMWSVFTGSGFGTASASKIVGQRTSR